MDLNTTWFILIGVLLTGYAILDGFDLGVGALSLFARNDEERRIHINAIAPVWDGNEVWLLTGGGALFAAFPIVYAEVFSGFYLAFMLLLYALIFRAVSMEFRGKVASPAWRRTWDWAFGIGSLLPAILFGVAYGNILRGIPLDASLAFQGDFIGLLNPYAILIGLFSLALFVMHGALYLALKTDGELRDRLRRFAFIAWIAVVALFVVATLGSVSTARHLFSGLSSRPLFWFILPLLLMGLAVIPAFIARAPGAAFAASAAVIACLMALSGVSLYPRLAPSSIDLANSLTIYNASSSPLTLTVMLVIALLGMPIVIGYTIYIYRVFHGKVVLNEDSY